MTSREPAWITITAKRPALDLGLLETWQYRELVWLFVRRNFVVNFRQTLLGPAWYLAQPLTTTAVFTVVFGMIARIPTDQIPTTLFYMSGVILWSNFSTNVTATSDVFVTNNAVFGKVYFPRMAVPIAAVLTNFITLFLQFGAFVTVFAVEWWSGAVNAPRLAALLIVPILIANAALALGVGFLFSGLTTRYRDLTQVLAFALQIWGYATPIIYPLSQVPERWRLLVAVNPMTTSVELSRLLLFANGTVSIAQAATSTVIAAIVIFLGLLVFNKAAVRAVDTI